MRLALDIFQMVAELLTVKQENNVLIDPTVYEVKTNQHQYAGKILFQDSVMIKLQVNEAKVIKILKENIEKITIQK